MNRLVGYRTMLGLTQQEMADRLGISKQKYWNKEHERTPLTDKEKITIKEMLLPHVKDITVDTIFFYSKSTKSTVWEVKLCNQ